MGADIRVVLVDDHDLFRKGLRELLAEEDGLEVIGEAADGAAALELAARMRPDVMVMDLKMPRMSGVEATRRLSEIDGLCILMLTVSAEDESVVDAIRAGASGYVLKVAAIEEIAAAIRTVASGQLLVSPTVARAVVAALAEPADRSRLAARITARLSDREVEVLRLLATGKGNAEIAEEMYLSPATVKNHVAEILDKLDVENRVEAAVLAARAQVL
jgi:DNA-binding NarL/FixJ family response regulator